MKTSLAIAAILLPLLGCSSCPIDRDHVPELSEAEVIDIANGVAKSAGYRLEDYALPDAHFEYTKRTCTWSIFYSRIDDAEPGHFHVILNDRTKKSDVFGGT